MGRDPPKSPDHPRRTAKRGRRADEVRRARLYVAELGWLCGSFEDVTHWRRHDTDELITLDGVRISKSRRGARTVMREHPLALRELVGDVERWWAVVDAKLAWTSALVAGKPARFEVDPHLPARQRRALAAMRSGPLGGAATIAAIAWLGELPELDRILGWLQAHEAELAALVGTIGTIDAFDRFVLVLARLALDGATGKAAATRTAGVGALIAALALDAPHPFSALDASRNLESALLEQNFTPAADAGRTRAKLVDWTIKLSRAETATRQRALALIAVTGIAEAFAPWQAWERSEDKLFARARELGASSWDAWDRADHVDRVIGNLQAARKRAPEPIALSDLISEIDMLACPALVRFHASIVRLLAAVPAQPVHARPRMLLHLARAAACASDEERIEWLWDELAALHERQPAPKLLRPWLPIIHTTGRVWVDADLVEGVTRRSDIARVVRVLAQLDDNTAVKPDYHERIGHWLAAGLAESTTAELVARFYEDLETDEARLAIALSDGTAADIAVIAKPMSELELRYDSGRRLVSFGERMVRIGGGWLVRGALLANQGARLSEVATIVTSITNKSEWPKLYPPEAPWIDRYPEALAPALRRLASVDADAEATAARRLADDIPDPRDLEREILTLRASGRAPKRLANLERRLASPKPPSAKRLANLAGKLEVTARELWFTRFAREATEVSGARVVKMFGLPGWPAWADPPDRTQAARLREILFALVDLESAADRELAGKLLRARCGPPPWDLRDEPANRAFLERLRKANIDPGPWLDDTPHSFAVAHDQPLSLSLSSDPLDVFAMGLHFDTCLSPRGGNFFSVVANAADINKRVLYARRDGKVVGRCLFALTDGLALLVFQQYCHEQIAFSNIVRDFAADLARRMRTTMVARGPVRTLLARDWYDDGARDLVGRFEGLGEDFDFEAVPPEELVGRLRELLGRDLDDVTLPIVIGHRNLRDQPRHLAPLVPFLLASRAAQTRIEAAELALANGDAALADRLLGEYDVAIEVEDHAWPRGEILARLRPSSALARLRRTRPSRVRSWSDDRADRIALAGVALETLKRGRQAAAMYRLAAKTEDWLADSMKIKLEALGEPVEGEVAD